MTKFSKFDASEYLTDEKTIAEYIAAAAQDDDPRILISALEDVVKARGMARVAEDAGLGRTSFYKVFKEPSKPHFGTVFKIFKALKLQMVFVPEEIEPVTKSRAIKSTATVVKGAKSKGVETVAVPKTAAATNATKKKPAAPKTPRQRKPADRHISA